MEPFFQDTIPLPDLGVFGESCALFFALLIGHALADFPWQGEYLARFKNRHHPGQDIRGHSETVWPYVLTAHALIHAGVVWLITGSFFLGLLEFVLHWVIDLAKNEGWSNFHIDQGLHVATKVLIVVLLVWAGGSIP
jgi:hypothetical protein